MSKIKMELQEWCYYEFAEFGVDEVELTPEEIAEIKKCYTEFERIKNLINKKITNKFKLYGDQNEKNK